MSVSPTPKQPFSPDAVALVSTGGTISAEATARGAHATRSGSDLLQTVAVEPPQTVIELPPKDSSALTFADLDLFRQTVAQALGIPGDKQPHRGVVVTHGTDTMEETAYLLDLMLGAAVRERGQAVVLTGAQRPADDLVPDGPENLAAALRLAPRVTAGVWVAFGGVVLQPPMLRKRHTTELWAFDNPAGAQWLRENAAPPGAAPAADPAPDPAPSITDLRRSVPIADLATVRVAIVPSYPGIDPAIIPAVAALSDGLILEGTGSANTSPQVVQEIARLRIPVVVTSRVPDGPIRPAYGGGGGGADLAAAGAVLSTYLRAPQARIALAALVANGTADHATLTEFFTAT